MSSSLKDLRVEIHNLLIKILLNFNLASPSASLIKPNPNLSSTPSVFSSHQIGVMRVLVRLPQNSGSPARGTKSQASWIFRSQWLPISRSGPGKDLQDKCLLTGDWTSESPRDVRTSRGMESGWALSTLGHPPLVSRSPCCDLGSQVGGESTPEGRGLALHRGYVKLIVTFPPRVLGSVLCSLGWNEN